MEKTAQILILVHAIFGGIALLSGGMSLIAKKGTRLHKKSGKLFFYSMLTSTTLSLLISQLPNHKSPFLFCIGLFSGYFVIGGYKSLVFKSKKTTFKTDKLFAYAIIIVGLAMIAYPPILEGKSDVVLLVFGIASIIFGAIDLWLFGKPQKIKEYWLQIHLSKMISGYVAAVTAFVVVNQFIPGVWAWFTPAIFGNFYLAYWLLKLKKRRIK